MKTFDPTNCPGVYQIKNMVTGDIYVGSTTRSFKIRWAQHKSDLSRNKGSRYLNGAWNKYGPDKFEFSVLVVCAKEHVLLYEQRAIDTLKPAYNLSPTAGNTAGVVFSLERKRKIAAALTGRPHHATRAAEIDGVYATYVIHAERIGIVDAAQVRARLSRGWDMEKALKTPLVPMGHGLKSDAVRAKMSISRRGKPANISPEKLKARNQKIADANRTRVITDEHRENASAASYARGVGKKHLVMGELITAHEVGARYQVSRHTFIKRVQAGWTSDDAATRPLRDKNV